MRRVGEAVQEDHRRAIDGPAREMCEAPRTRRTLFDQHAHLYLTARPRARYQRPHDAAAGFDVALPPRPPGPPLRALRGRRAAVR